MAKTAQPPEPSITPDGRYIVVRGRLWRAANPSLSKTRRATLVKRLMAARRAVRFSSNAGDLRIIRATIDSTKRDLGERGPVWWTDGSPDYNRHLVKNTPYAAWHAKLARKSRSHRQTI